MTLSNQYQSSLGRQSFGFSVTSVEVTSLLLVASPGSPDGSESRLLRTTMSSRRAASTSAAGYCHVDLVAAGSDIDSVPRNLVTHVDYKLGHQSSSSSSSGIDASASVGWTRHPRIRLHCRPLVDAE